MIRKVNKAVIRVCLNVILQVVSGQNKDYHRNGPGLKTLVQQKVFCYHTFLCEWCGKVALIKDYKVGILANFRIENSVGILNTDRR